MRYKQHLHNYYPDVTSKAQSLQLLNKYKNELTPHEYEAIYHSLCSHALENIYLNEKDILVSIAHLRQEITLDEVVELAKAS